MSNQGNLQPNWHPNFRIESTLPDMRAIHTGFIVKATIYTILLISALFVSQREYQAYALRKTISNLELQIQDATPADSSMLKKSAQFRKQSLNVKELQQFFSAPLLAHESVVELSSIKPKDLIFTSLELSELSVQVKRSKKKRPENIVLFKLRISGNVEDLPLLTQFKRELENSLLLNPFGYAVNIDENIEQRDADTGIIPFTLTISLEKARKGAK